MSKAVLMSIQPKWCELIASGKKTVEVRKTRPKIDVPFKCYIYESKGKKKFFSQPSPIPYYEGKGKVIGEFVCKHITNIEVLNKGLFTGGYPNGSCTLVVSNSALTAKEIKEYANGKKIVYGWHISNLIIYDKPKELEVFFFPCDKSPEYDCSKCIDLRENRCKSITRPPQSWCYVEEQTAQA